MRTKGLRCLCIIPTYDERENLPRLVSDLLGRVPGLEVLVVDDGSPDGTADVAGELAEATGRVRVLRRAGKMGLGSAYVTGFGYALEHGYDYVIQMDADLSHRPEDLPCLLEAAREGASVVIGSRYVPGGRVEDWSTVRRLVSKGGNLYARNLLGLPIRDCTSGFKCFRREALESTDFTNLKSNGYSFQVEMNYLCHHAGLRIVEVPIVFPDRTAGRSKMSLGIVQEAAIVVWKLHYRKKPSYRSRSGESVGLQPYTYADTEPGRPVRRLEKGWVSE